MSNNYLGLLFNSNQKNFQQKEQKAKERGKSQSSLHKIPNIITQVKPFGLNNFSQPLNLHKASFTPSNKTKNIFQSDYLLPPKKLEYMNKKTLILDLDETLVHSTTSSLEKSDIILDIDFEGILYNIYVLIRPGAENFIKQLSNFFELVIFTASLSKYASPLLDKLDKDKNIKYRLYREHCTFLNGIYIKELKRLNRDLKDVIIVDNSPLAYAFNMENGLPIKSWYEDKNDNEFEVIFPLLMFLSKVDDVREYIKLFVENNEIKYEQAFKIITANNNIENNIIKNDDINNKINNEYNKETNDDNKTNNEDNKNTKDDNKTNNEDIKNTNEDNKTNNEEIKNVNDVTNEGNKIQNEDKKNTEKNVVDENNKVYNINNNNSNKYMKPNNILSLHDFLSPSNNKIVGNLSKKSITKTSLKSEDMKNQNINSLIKVNYNNNINKEQKKEIDKTDNISNNIKYNILNESLKKRKTSFRNKKNAFRLNKNLGYMSLKNMPNNENNNKKINSIFPLTLSLTNSTKIKKTNNMNNLKLVSIKDISNKNNISKNNFNNNHIYTNLLEKLKSNKDIYNNSLMSITNNNKKNQNLMLTRNSKSFKLTKNKNLLIKTPSFIQQSYLKINNNKNNNFNYLPKTFRSKSTGNFNQFNINKAHPKTPKSNQRFFNLELFEGKNNNFILSNKNNNNIYLNGNKLSKSTKHIFSPFIEIKKCKIKIKKLGLKGKNK